MADAAPPSLELKQLGRDSKSLKHKHKGRRAQPTGGGGSGAPDGESPTPAMLKRSPAHHHAHGKRGAAAGAKTSREDALRELLAGKIAEIEVGGDENLEAPIDLSGASRRWFRHGAAGSDARDMVEDRYLPGRDGSGQGT